MSYTDGAGEALNTTDLTDQTDAEAALNMLNVAISDVAAQDGYIGAQINTLNSHQPGDEHAAGERGLGAERDTGDRLCFSDFEHVEVRDSEPDRHRRISAG